ncbi:bifunctional tetrahydrofolate synthase/dihydrofolate synthase [Salinisphaera sp. SPP-AMP-43]|uniref:bifunctional tetrahydrofolate synthase/dihydrofolate synthase n=1 Tax=Salinisphaera sp. SPP-AMP-43 TaxID=3121288 RepID=UPI003C6DF60E
MNVPSTLEQWLDYQLSLHSREIELGLDRVRTVAERLDLLAPRHRTITVAGTNGKGSTVALIGGLLGQRCRVGAYTSPHLWRYNERVAVDGEPATDAALVAAFETIERARGDIPLTFFEFGTLAALWVFAQAGVDVAVLEVGLGGRLDAVNILDADVAVITRIGLDHTDWLGDTREAIGAEKAGIMRGDQSVFCSDREAPASIAASAAACGARLYSIGSEFNLSAANGHWQWTGPNGRLLSCAPHAEVHPDNLAAAVATVADLGWELAAEDIERACRVQAKLPGRREVIDGPIPIIYDVGHNDDAVALLVDELERRPAVGWTHVVIGMLADKPVEAVGQRLAAIADRFYPAGLDTVTPRGLSAEALAARLGHVGPTFDDPSAALNEAGRVAARGDRIVVCGSFFTVAQARSPEHE